MRRGRLSARAVIYLWICSPFLSTLALATSQSLIAVPVPERLEHFAVLPSIALVDERIWMG